MAIIKGRTIKLHERTKTGEDAFGAPIYTFNEVLVDNVLIEPTSADEVVTEMQLYGKKSVFTLHIPKGDTHNWEDMVIEFFDKQYRSFGAITEYQEELLPLAWSKKVKVARYE